MGSNPAQVETIFRPLIRLARNRHALGYKVDRAALGDIKRHQVCKGDP